MCQLDRWKASGAGTGEERGDVARGRSCNTRGLCLGDVARDLVGDCRYTREHTHTPTHTHAHTHTQFVLVRRAGGGDS